MKKVGTLKKVHMTKKYMQNVQTFYVKSPTMGRKDSEYD